MLNKQIRYILLFHYVGLLLLSSTHSVLAEQITYNKEKQQTTFSFSYSWHDSYSQTQNLQFSLPANAFSRQVHKRFVNQLAQQYVYIELHKAARLIDPKEARVSINKDTQGIQIRVKSRSEQLLQKWQAAMQQSEKDAFNQYLNDHYYSRFTSYLGQEAIKPDHLRYISENKLPLLPVAQAIYENLAQNSETRAYVNVLLSWIQSIPYNPLESRLSSNGAGFLPPLAVIESNQGDCDSKSVLMASLIRSLLPDVKMVMIYLPNHALLGISLPYRTNEKTFTIEETPYLLMEPTGPAIMPLGMVGNDSNADIVNGLYSYESIP